jgi:hypothetical protein
MAFKILGSENVIVRPFKVHKSQVVTYISGSTAIAEINVATAKQFPLSTVTVGPDSGSQVLVLDDFVPTAATNEDGTFQEPLFSSVKHLFYESASQSGSISGTFRFAAAGDGYRNFLLSGSAYVVNIAQALWGEGIRPGSFVLTTPSAGSGSIIDDARGHLYVGGSGSVVGNIFYNLGVAIVHRLTSATGDELIQESGSYLPSGSTLQADFEATQQLYEYTILATMEPMEFNFSNNPSFFKKTLSGSIEVEKVLDLVESGTLSPYITTIGLYNDRQQLVAVAKVPRPLKRLATSQQSVVIRFDV